MSATAVQKITAKDVLRGLQRRHAQRPGEWVCIPEAFSGYSTMTGGIDLLAVGAWRSAKAKGLTGAGGRSPRTHCTVAYEVKVSRADFRNDLYGKKPSPGTRRRGVLVEQAPWPSKQHDALRFTNYFMFATPPGLLHDDEIERREPWGDESPRRGALYLPADVGLVEVSDRGCTVRADAEWTERDDWTPAMHHELLRRAQYLGDWWTDQPRPESEERHG